MARPHKLGGKAKMQDLLASISSPMHLIGVELGCGSSGCDVVRNILCQASSLMKSLHQP